jgi:hypothetical protein
MCLPIKDLRLFEKNCKILFMAQKRYSMTFTETTWKLVCSLEKRGNNVRDIINAGIVLFDVADTDRKWEARLRAYNNLPEDVKDLERRLEIAKKEALRYQQSLPTEPIQLTWDNEEINCDVADAAAKQTIADAEAYEAAHSKKKRGKPSKSA